VTQAGRTPTQQARFAGLNSRDSRLQLYTSNRLKLLAEQLAAVFAKPLSSALKPEVVVVQSLGISRWLTQQLARHQSICANIHFLFPQKFVATLFDEALPGRAAGRFYAREILTWRVMGLLPPLLPRPEFETLRRYVEQTRAELRLFQLAGKIATAFDQYLAYRPQLILDWERGHEDHWQAILWREIKRSAPGLHPPALAGEFSAALAKGTAGLPERVSFFSVSTLPEFYVQFLQDISRHTDVHLFVMQPTPQWWSDIRSAREEARARKKAPPSAQLHLQFERGNPLLASMGKLGRDFLDIVSDLTPAQEHDCAREPQGHSMLAQIQRDIFQLNPGAPLTSDTSLQIHSCHSPMREMEVLHDQLLARFENDDTLKPHDIVVMAPDISAYAPFIEAVFDTSPDAQRIPFSISDRGTRAENGIVDTFLRILESVGSRFTASSVMSIFESVALQRRFSLTESDLETIRTWVEKTGIRWGIDAAHRAEFDLPAFGENSWRAGLDRLLLGYAAPAHGEQLFDGILAFDELEGSLAETLGNFSEFIETLFTAAANLKNPRPLIEWQETLRALAERFFEIDDESEAETRQLRRVIEALGEAAALSAFEDAIPLDVLLAHLDQALATTESGVGFLVGRVTFCALRPMRSVPFRVVCLVGMNDTAYPRHSTAPAFDLIAQNPKRGDRSTRDDDRYLFLEALLSARDVFYISYVGQSIRDNSKLPPSVLVSELLDYTGCPVTEHKLQPFNAAYFAKESALFSYSAENCAASEVASAGRATPPPFIVAPISEPEDEWRRLDSKQLINFFGHPAKFFIKERLQIRPAEDDELLEDSEPTEMHQLAKYNVQQELLARAVKGEPLEPLLPIIRARGELPPRHAGEARLRGMCEAAEEFGALVRQHTNHDGTAEPREVLLTIDRFELRARFDNLQARRLVRYRLTTRKPKDLIGAWIEHLMLNCEEPAESLLISADKNSQPFLENFVAIDSATAREQLHELLDLYWKGLREPLRLFPKTSLHFVEREIKPSRDSTPLQSARKKWAAPPEQWEADRGAPPESKDDYFHMAFRHVADPLDEEFQRVARAVFLPPLEAQKN
jgi:exodeoxyribonuclease V gamma subunit